MNKFAKTCNRCGEANLQWVTSKRTGYTYLVQTTGGPDVCGDPIPFMPHKCPPVGTQQHTTEGRVTFTGKAWELESARGARPQASGSSASTKRG